jgi:hypothetical protein
MPTLALNAAKSSILFALWFCIALGKEYVTYVSINKMLELLSQYHNVHIGRRWLLQCEKYLEDEGYIRRKRRYRHLAGGLIRSIPSRWSFTVKGMKWLVSKGAEGARRFLNNMISYLKNKDGRLPTKQDFFAPLNSEKGLIDIQRLKHKAEGVTKDMP